MPTYLTPGVYVEEVPSQSKPIEGVGTSTAAFVGLAPGGPVNVPMRISNWTQFARIYGDPANPDNGPFMEGAYLAHSVYGYFANGGSLCWIVRVGKETGAPRAQVALPAAADTSVETLRALAKADGDVSIEISEEPTRRREGGRDLQGRRQRRRGQGGVRGPDPQEGQGQHRDQDQRRLEARSRSRRRRFRTSSRSPRPASTRSRFRRFPPATSSPVTSRATSPSAREWGASPRSTR